MLVSGSNFSGIIVFQGGTFRFEPVRSKEPRAFGPIITSVVRAKNYDLIGYSKADVFEFRGKPKNSKTRAKWARSGRSARRGR